MIGDIFVFDSHTTTVGYADTSDIIDTLHKASLSFTISNPTQTAQLDYKVLAANLVSFIDAVEIVAETILGVGSNTSYSVTPPPYRFYKVVTKLIGAPTVCHVTAIVKG